MHISDLPLEMLDHVFSFVDCATLVKSGRLVCRQWKQIIEEGTALHEHAVREKKISRRQHYPWFALYAICAKGLFDKKLIVNACGKGGKKGKSFEGWKTINNGGGGWLVECPPVGSNPVIPEECLDAACLEPGESFSCFATSYGPCTKSQLIDIRQYGMTKTILEAVNPGLVISEWYAPRFDCASVYELKVQFLDENMKIFDTKDLTIEMDSFTDADWNEAQLIFPTCNPKLRYINFFHSGQDRQFWAGHYGAKMSCASIRFCPLGDVQKSFPLSD